MEVLRAIAAASYPLLALMGLLGFFVRSTSDRAAADKVGAAMDKVEVLGKSLLERIDALKDAIAGINTTLKVAEERHAALADASVKLEARVSEMEREVFRGVSRR